MLTVAFAQWHHRRHLAPRQQASGVRLGIKSFGLSLPEELELLSSVSWRSTPLLEGLLPNQKTVEKGTQGKLAPHSFRTGDTHEDSGNNVCEKPHKTAPDFDSRRLGLRLLLCGSHSLAWLRPPPFGVELSIDVE